MWPLLEGGVTAYGRRSGVCVPINKRGSSCQCVLSGQKTRKVMYKCSPFWFSFVPKSLCLKMLDKRYERQELIGRAGFSLAADTQLCSSGHMLLTCSFSSWKDSQFSKSERDTKPRISNTSTTKWKNTSKGWEPVYGYFSSGVMFYVLLCLLKAHFTLQTSTLQKRLLCYSPCSSTTTKFWKSNQWRLEKWINWSGIFSFFL